MVRANLHIICGNCGSNEDMTYKIEEEGRDFGDHFEPAVYLICANCSTLHDLSDTIEVEKPDPDDYEVSMRIGAICNHCKPKDVDEKITKQKKAGSDWCTNECARSVVLDKRNNVATCVKPTKKEVSK